MTLTVPRPPAVLPRLLLAAGAAGAALVLPLPVAAGIAVGAFWPLRRRADAALLRAAFTTTVALTVATLVLTPIWLHLLVGVPERTALQTALALALRLDAVLLVGLALSAGLPPVAWLAATRRLPRLGLVLTLTFRQVPELASLTERIRRAQRARGLTAAPRLMRPVAVAVPVVVRSLERAERLGGALALAGWSARVPRHPVVQTRWNLLDAVWSVGGLLLLSWTLLAFLNLG